MAQNSENQGARQVWRGRSGRTYRLVEGAEVRRGSKATVRPVLAEGPPVDGSDVPQGTVLALKVAWKGNPDAPDALDREAGVLAQLSAPGGPCPRLIDTVGEERPGQPGRVRHTGMLLEWCPTNLESWWVERIREPNQVPALLGALVQVCERVVAYQEVFRARAPGEGPAARIKPRNIVLGGDGRWLLTDFDEVQIKGLYEEHLSATQPLLGGESFLSPEVLFSAGSTYPGARDTWSVATSLYALLRLRPYLLAGAMMPSDGTGSPHFRTHRMHLVTDLHTRKPTLLAGRPLDPSQFLYPDRLPDQDRRALAQAVDGLFGDPGREALLHGELVRILDQALRVDPGQRYTDAAPLGRELAALARRAQSWGAPATDGEDMDEATQIVRSEDLFAGLSGMDAGATLQPSDLAGGTPRALGPAPGLTRSNPVVPPGANRTPPVRALPVSTGPVAPPPPPAAPPAAPPPAAPMLTAPRPLPQPVPGGPPVPVISANPTPPISPPVAPAPSAAPAPTAAPAPVPPAPQVSTAARPAPASAAAVGALETRLASLQGQIAGLEARVKELESRPASGAPERPRAPAWLIAATGLLGLMVLGALGLSIIALLRG